MPIRNVKIILDDIHLQVDTDGFKPGTISIVDDGQAWLSRDKIGAVRADDDSLGFDVAVLSGKRIRVAYTQALLPNVSVNNNLNADSIYRKYMEYSYAISGKGLSRDDANALFSKYTVTQQHWANRQRIIAQINDPDVSLSKREVLITELNAVYTALDSVDCIMVLDAYGTTANVVFGEGNTCQFSDWVIADYTDFTFTVMNRSLVTAPTP